MVNQNTMHPELIGSTSELQVMINMVASSRAQMQGAHYAQATQLVGAEKRNLFTGSEYTYGRFMFNCIVEHDCHVVRVFRRKATAMMDDRTVLDTMVFVRRKDAKSTLDVIYLPQYQSNHQYFGYDYVLTEAGQPENLKVNTFLKAGTVLAECPTVIDEEWCIGTHANCILVSHPDVIEDAFTMSDHLADKMMSYGYKTYRMYFGEKEYPLFLYGDDENPEIHPKVGEKVRPDGILFGKREYDPILAAIEMTREAITEPCCHFDDCTVVDPESVVIDVKVWRDEIRIARDKNGQLPAPHPKLSTPQQMQEQCDEYVNGMKQFYKEIRDFYKTYKSSRPERRLEMTGPARQVITDSIASDPIGTSKEGYRRRQFGNEMLDDYMIEITVKYPIPLDVSGKATDTMGGKGVCGNRLPQHMMPVDEYGNVVDLMMSDNAVLRRCNFNRPFEIYVNAARRDVEIRAREMMAEGKYDEAWDYIMGFCDVVSKPWADKIRQSHESLEAKAMFLEELKYEKLRLWIPTNLNKEPCEIEWDIERLYPPRRSKLTVTLPDGTKEKTESEFIVGEIYMIRLDKTGREMSAISAGRFQHFGTISKQHSSDKHRRPLREHPIKFMGESEARHLQAYVGGDICAEIHDRSNNPAVMEEMVTNVLTAEVPMNIDCVVSRDKFPLGHNRSMALTHHVHGCEGVEFTKRRKGEPRQRIKPKGRFKQKRRSRK